MKKRILIISLLIVSLMLTFCAGNSGSGSGGGEFSRYFADTTPEMKNNVWVNCDGRGIESCSAIGVIGVGYKEVDGEERFAVTYRIIADKYDSGYGQDTKVITIRQALSSGGTALFKCIGGEPRNEATGVGLHSYDGSSYTPYQSLVPLSIKKEIFKDKILSKVSDDDRKFLLSIYEHGSAPKKMNSIRFNSIKKKLEDGNLTSELTLFESSYEKKEETSTWYDLKEGVNEQNLLEALSKAEHDYTNFYIKKWDLVEWDGLQMDKSLLMEKKSWEKARDIFFDAGYVPSLEWTLYFNTKGTSSGEERTFDPYKPFTVKENCTTGCYNIENIEILGEIEGKPRP